MQIIDKKEGTLSQSLFAYRLFLLYIVSIFLNLPQRIEFLGLIHFDLMLAAMICFFIVSNKTSNSWRLDNASRYLLFIFIYSIVVLPLVEWPGSVVNRGLEGFIKGAIFYFFTINLILSERRMKVLLTVFVFCNVIRILEPLYMHITIGYWGSKTHLGGGEFAQRLSGAPSDVINPNGLAFVIATVFPFLHYIYSSINKKAFMVYLVLVPLLLYAQVLTLSRSGFLALGIIAFGVFLKSRRKGLLLVLGVTGLVLVWSSMTEIQRDRYLSLVSEDTKSAQTAEGRIKGWADSFEVALNRPFVGHGLGTSREANWNIAGRDQPAHILWAEVWQEIGLIGLILFILYLRSMISNFIQAGQVVKKNLPESDFLYRSTQAMQVWLLMNLLFSLASYGLSSYEWYFFGGLSVVLLNFAEARVRLLKEGNSEPKKSARYPLRSGSNVG